MKAVLEAVKTTGGDEEDNGARRKKKRKVSLPAPGESTEVVMSGGEKLSLLSRYARLFVVSSSKLLTNTLPTQLLESLKDENRSLLTEIALPLVEFGLGGAGGEEREMVLASGLRLVGGLREVLGEGETDQVVNGVEGRLGKLGGVLVESKIGGEVKLEIVSLILLRPSSSRAPKC